MSSLGGPTDRDTHVAAFLREFRAALEDRMRSHMDEADASDDDGSHVGFARHHRALASGLHEAVNLLDEMWRQRAA